MARGHVREILPGLRPDPPALKDAVKDLNAEIFSVIRNGTNMTGMPGFNLEI